MTSSAPKVILFAQHGWADDNKAMLALTKDLATDDTVVIAPSLSFLMTWLRISPLVDEVEAIAREAFERYPGVPGRIIGHSMGGLIWLEVLNRHPDWWASIESLVLLASPVGGADLGRILDPWQVGIGIAADLGQNRRPIAEKITAVIPSLVIAGDVDGGSDGTIPVESTKVCQAQFVCLTGLSHAQLRHHPVVVEQIQQFWQGQRLSDPLQSHPVIQRLQAVPGITDAHLRGFKQAKPFMTLADGASIRLWRSTFGIDHVFVVSPEGDCLYAGYVGWAHSLDLWQTLQSLKTEAAQSTQLD